MTQHIVTAAAVQIQAGGRAHFLETGALLPEGAAEADIERLTEEGLIEEYEVVETDVPEVTYFTQDDVDAAVKAAVDAKDTELAEARKALAEELAEFEKAKAAAAKPPTPAKATAAKQS